MRSIRTIPLAMALVILVVSLAACGAGGDAQDTEEELYDLNTIPYDAGEFTINIKDSKTILRCTIKIELISEKLSETLAEKDYIVSDLINTKLSQLTEPELLSMDRESLAQSLVDALNETMNTKGFYKVYFTSFVHG